MPPICKWLDHQEAEIRLDLQHRPSPPYCRATVWWVDGRQIRRLNGRWARMRGILVTAVVLGSA